MIFFYTKGHTFPPVGYYFAVLSLFAVLGAWRSLVKEAFRDAEQLALIIFALYKHPGFGGTVRYIWY